jgi:hypothetical protein
MRRYLGDIMTDFSDLEAITDSDEYLYYIQLGKWDLVQSTFILLNKSPEKFGLDGRWSEFKYYDKEDYFQDRDYKRICSVLRKNLFYYVGDEEVSVSKILLFAKEKRINIPTGLLDAVNDLGIIFNEKKEDGILADSKKNTRNSNEDKRKNTHQLKRDTVNGAALCAVANFYERCKAGNKLSGMKIVEVIEQEEELSKFVKNKEGKFIKEKQGMINQINSCLRLNTINKESIH